MQLRGHAQTPQHTHHKYLVAPQIGHPRLINPFGGYRHRLQVQIVLNPDAVMDPLQQRRRINSPSRPQFRRPDFCKILFIRSQHFVFHARVHHISQIGLVRIPPRPGCRSLSATGTFILFSRDLQTRKAEIEMRPQHAARRIPPILLAQRPQESRRFRPPARLDTFHESIYLRMVAPAAHQDRHESRRIHAQFQATRRRPFRRIKRRHIKMTDTVLH